MKNRIPDLLSFPPRNGQPSQPVFQEWRNPDLRQFVERLRQIATYVKPPAAAVGAGFCIGVFLGWIIKRR